MKINMTLIDGRLCGWLSDNFASVRASTLSVITTAGEVCPFLPYIKSAESAEENGRTASKGDAGKKYNCKTASETDMAAES